MVKFIHKIINLDNLLKDHDVLEMKLIILDNGDNSCTITISGNGNLL